MTTALESLIRRATTDHHATTIFKADRGDYGGASDETYNQFIARGMELVFGWGNVGPEVVDRYRRTVRGLATILQYGCIEFRKMEDDKPGSGYAVALVILGEMSDLQRAQVYHKTVVAGGTNMAKNSIGPDQPMTVKKTTGHQMETSA